LALRNRVGHHGAEPNGRECERAEDPEQGRGPSRATATGRPPGPSSTETRSRPAHRAFIIPVTYALRAPRPGRDRTVRSRPPGRHEHAAERGFRGGLPAAGSMMGAPRCPLRLPVGLRLALTVAAPSGYRAETHVPACEAGSRRDQARRQFCR
jgi:hypothetical protein